MNLLLPFQIPALFNENNAYARCPWGILWFEVLIIEAEIQIGTTAPWIRLLDFFI